MRSWVYMPDCQLSDFYCTVDTGHVCVFVFASKDINLCFCTLWGQKPKSFKVTEDEQTWLQLLKHQDRHLAIRVEVNLQEINVNCNLKLQKTARCCVFELSPNSNHSLYMCKRRTKCFQAGGSHSHWLQTYLLQFTHTRYPLLSVPCCTRSQQQ